MILYKDVLYNVYTTYIYIIHVFIRVHKIKFNKKKMFRNCLELMLYLIYLTENKYVCELL